MTVVRRVLHGDAVACARHARRFRTPPWWQPGLMAGMAQGIAIALPAGAVQAASDGAAHSSPNPLTLGPDLAVVTAIVFLLLLAVLSKFAWRPILEALDRRERHIADNIEAAGAKNDEARRLLADYEGKLSGAAEDVRTLLDEARRDAERTKGQIMAEAKSAARAEQQRAQREIRGATQDALRELAQKSADMAVGLAGKIVEERISPDDHARLIRDAVARFPSDN